MDSRWSMPSSASVRAGDLTRTLTTAGRTFSTTSAKLRAATPWTRTASARAGVVRKIERSADEGAAEHQRERRAEQGPIADGAWLV